MRSDFMASVIDIVYQGVVVIFVWQKVGRLYVASVWVGAIENQVGVVHKIENVDGIIIGDKHSLQTINSFF